MHVAMVVALPCVELQHALNLIIHILDGPEHELPVSEKARRTFGCLRPFPCPNPLLPHL